MSEHRIKCWPEFFDAIQRDLKRFEIRENDRGFKVGDVIDLQEWEPRTGRYTGRTQRVEVLYLTGWGQPGSQVVMSIKREGAK